MFCELGTDKMIFIPQNGFAEGIEFSSKNPKLFKVLVHAVDDNPELVKSSFELTKRVVKKTSKSKTLKRIQQIDATKLPTLVETDVEFED